MTGADSKKKLHGRINNKYRIARGTENRKSRIIDHLWMQRAGWKFGHEFSKDESVKKGWRGSIVTGGGLALLKSPGRT